MSQVNFPSNNLNFHWRWWDWIQAIFLNIFYFIIYILSSHQYFWHSGAPSHLLLEIPLGSFQWFDLIGNGNYNLFTSETRLILSRTTDAWFKYKYTYLISFCRKESVWSRQNHRLKVRLFQNVFLVSSISSKNERKQVDLRFHISKVEFVCSFFGENVYLKKLFRLFLTSRNGQYQNTPNTLQLFWRLCPDWPKNLRYYRN